MNSLQFNLNKNNCDNHIYDEDDDEKKYMRERIAKSISSALFQLKNLNYLQLDLRSKIDDAGAELLSLALR